MAETISVAPDENLRKVWLVIWASLTILCCVVPIVLLLVFAGHASEPEDVYLAVFVFSCVMVPLDIFLLVWLLLFFQSLKYEITDLDIRITSGVWWRRVREIPLMMITDVMSIQGPLERLFHVGHLRIQTAGRGGESPAEGILRGLKDFISKRQEIVGRIGKVKSVREILMSDGSGEGKTITLLTGILNELRELRVYLSKDE
jgi:membrane protein YdbS with pleckstrin-like domain